MRRGAAALAVAFVATFGWSAADAGCSRACRDAARTTAASVRMIDLPGGRFMMGTDDGLPQQGHPRHGVTLRAFRIGATEVTFDQYDAFARATGRDPPVDEGFGRGARPVIDVHRGEMLAFIDWLNVATGRRFRLPTEAEWEYAARGGTDTAFFWGDEPSTRYANTGVNEAPDVYPKTAPVASFPPNAFGLHDTAGNVWEMVADCRHADYVGAPDDGRAWLGDPCDSYVVRGGYFNTLSRGVRPSARGAAGPWFRGMGLGFRLAEDAAAPH